MYQPGNLVGSSHVEKVTGLKMVQNMCIRIDIVAWDTIREKDSVVIGAYGVKISISFEKAMKADL